MKKKLLFSFFLFLVLTNCANPGTALLGPILTGAKTGSIYQASLSYTTNQIVKKASLEYKKNKSNRSSTYPQHSLHR